MTIKNIIAESVMMYIDRLSDEFLDFCEQLLEMKNADIIAALKENKDRFTEEDRKIINKVI